MKDKISSGAMVILIAVSAILFVMSMMDNVDPILYGSYVFFGIGLVVALIGAVTGLIADPSSIKGIGIGIVGMAIVLGAAYGLADGSDYVNYENTSIDLSEGMSRFSGMLLYAIYILMGASIVTLVFSRIYSLMR
tara:strand:- start:29792 stop:30196 length:405 start_codon:yes stop_codon:yes gene_type:complete